VKNNIAKIILCLGFILSSHIFAMKNSSLPVSVSSLEELIKLLDSHGIGQSEWIKPPKALFEEIQLGECFLEIKDGKLQRTVAVVTVECFYTNDIGEKFQLVETKQVFKSGTIRERGFKYIAEKMQAGEEPIQAALRGLKEELDVSTSTLQVNSKGDSNQYLASSKTYIGLPSTYNKYHFEHNISKENYKENYVEHQEDKDTFFSWIKIEQ